MHKKTIKQVDPASFKGKKVLVRVDFNVPQKEDLSIADDSRIRAAVPTIDFLRKNGARIILVSHLGRPKGISAKLSLAPVAKRLAELLGIHVHHHEQTVGQEVAHKINSMAEGEVCLLENVRFHPEEEKNDSEFAKQLAAHADIYVNDAFGTAHRAHASTQGVSQFVQASYAGLLMDKELKALSSCLDNPARPFATVIGGSKVSTKIGVLENLINKVDVLVIGGAMAFSFLKAEGKEVGKSLVENDFLDFCRKISKLAKEREVKLILPLDVVCAPELKSGISTTTVSAEAIPADMMGLDLGPQTMKLIRAELSACKTILWNGPLGAFEFSGFEKATYDLVDLLIELTAKGTRTVVGGGDSVAAIEAHGAKPELFTHVSTGGGASLEFIEGLELPGVACLESVETAKTK